MANTWAQSEDDQAKGMAREMELGLESSDLKAANPRCDGPRPKSDWS